MITIERGRVVATTRLISAIVICAVLVPARLLAQAPSIYYVYDELNRLVAVVDEQGRAATYTYDAVGNILRVDRFDAGGVPGVVAISMFTPSAGVVGTTVQVFGRGFAASPAQNTLSFGGEPSTIIAAAPTRLVVNVPTGAKTGPLAVTTPLGAATSLQAFRVLGELAITPQTLTLRALGRAAFTASEAGVPSTNVRWAVNGLAGGDPAVGTISADGVYTAPATVPVPPVVTITATHHDDVRLSASATVTLLPALIVSLSSPPVSVAGAAAPLTIDRSLAVALTALVPSATTALAHSAPVAVELEPVVLGVTPSLGTPGETLALTITGRGLGDATSLGFLRAGAVDSAFTVSNLVAEADGTRATAEVTIAANAVLGARVVQITTPAHASSPAGTGANVFTLQ